MFPTGERLYGVTYDPAPAAGCSPWGPASLSFTFFDDTPYNLTGRWFRQITPLGLRNTRPLGTVMGTIGTGTDR